MLSRLMETAIKICPIAEKVCKFYLNVTPNKAICTACGQSPEAGFCTKTIYRDDNYEKGEEED